ncbi:MAG TPA: phosphoribosyltransferase family protein [Stackebrandtia sp.]|jgi:adenine phosphoribosyltransferase|uniref:phosphoribosyltransferase family protein n=1 Tax=Stackebrandtia sp. TaxID=2023065 RepID=UPI002D4179BB|nr:phosphoribosyltransferase family protein [Stackebrandtia sp.]HZE40995.1 phosphoribosyltransferase family protein [Stackebrandtia sp.]
MDDATETLSSLLTWKAGGTDLWPLLRDPRATDVVAHGLATPFAGAVDVVLGPDPGGVLFGPLVARVLGVPFAPVCRDRAFFFQGPHEAVAVETPGGDLVAHRAALGDGARVLVVDDWSESGSTAKGVAAIVEATGARLVAIAFLVDSLDDGVRESLRGKGIGVHGLATPAGLMR